MKPPSIFIVPVFIKVLAWCLIIATAGLAGVIVISGHITTLDMIGTLMGAVIIAYIIHLWLFYGKGEED